MLHWNRKNIYNYLLLGYLRTKSKFKLTIRFFLDTSTVSRFLLPLFVCVCVRVCVYARAEFRKSWFRLHWVNDSEVQRTSTKKRSRFAYSSAVFRRENFCRGGGSLLNPRYYSGKGPFCSLLSVAEDGKSGRRHHLHLDDCRRIELQRKLIRCRVIEDVATSRIVRQVFEDHSRARAQQRELLLKPRSRRGLLSLRRNSTAEIHFPRRS